jgi:hypothetical protein
MNVQVASRSTTLDCQVRCIMHAQHHDVRHRSYKCSAVLCLCPNSANRCAFVLLPLIIAQQYRATDFVTDRPGKFEMKFTPEDGTEVHILNYYYIEVYYVTSIL